VVGVLSRWPCHCHYNNDRGQDEEIIASRMIKSEFMSDDLHEKRTLRDGNSQPSKFFFNIERLFVVDLSKQVRCAGAKIPHIL
jgi:hypothetical protein